MIRIAKNYPTFVRFLIVIFLKFFRQALKPILIINAVLKD